jgi:ABC-type transport system involved in multi-copper enzyme maturation permease subunit
MSWGLFLKTWREMRITFLLFGVGMMALQGLFAYVIPIAYEYSDVILKVKFVQKLIKGFLGAEIGPDFSPSSLAAIAWIHPLVLTTLWAYEIVFCTRMPAGEVDRGTIDLLLGLPVSRRRLFLCESGFWLASGAAVVLLGLAGALLGRLGVAAEFRPSKVILLMAASNLYGLYLAVGGVAWLVSCLSDHRGRAVAVIFAFLLFSFLLNFLSQIWEPIRAVQFLSVLNYHRPIEIVSEAAWPVRNMVTLALIGGAFWLAAGWAFLRRDICTV